MFLDPIFPPTKTYRIHRVFVPERNHPPPPPQRSKSVHGPPQEGFWRLGPVTRSVDGNVLVRTSPKIRLLSHRPMGEWEYKSDRSFQLWTTDTLS